MNDPLDWMTRELNKNNATLKDYTPRYNKSVSFDRIFKYDTNVVTKNPASVNYMKPFSFDLTCTKMNTERPKLVDKYLNNSTNKHLRIADRMRKVVGNVTVNRAVDMSNIPSEEQDKVLKILGMTESQLKDTKPENYFGTRIGRTGAKEQVIYNFDLWMQYPVLNEDAAHLEMNERYKINYAFGSPLVMGSIQGRTIWIQKSVYKPINWNDVEKLGIDNTNKAVIPSPNPYPIEPIVPEYTMPPVDNVNQTSMYPSVDTIQEDSGNAQTVQPTEQTIEQTQPNEVDEQKSDLTVDEVLTFCQWTRNAAKRLNEKGRNGRDTRENNFFDNLHAITKSLDFTHPSRYIPRLIDGLEEELKRFEIGIDYSVFSDSVRKYTNDPNILSILTKMENKSGMFTKEFWEDCKKASNKGKATKNTIGPMDPHPKETQKPPPMIF